MKHRRWSPSNIVAVLTALWVGANGAGGCSGSPQQSVLHVTVDSGHWYAKTVRVECESGRELGAVRGVVLGQEMSKRVWLMGCQTVQLRIEALGGEQWVSPMIPVEPGDTVRLRIGPTLALSSYFVRD